MYFLVVLVLIYGCSNPVNSNIDKCNECQAHIECDLPIDDNIYQLEFNRNQVQTFVQLKMDTNCGWSQPVEYDSDYQYQIGTDWVSLVNHHSMTDDSGVSRIMFGCWSAFIGYTITIYGGYYDSCDQQHLDSIKIKVN